jgi:hypothetical protein
VSVSGASGFTVFVFMASAWLRGAGQHIGKNPGVTLNLGSWDQGRAQGNAHG